MKCYSLISYDFSYKSKFGNAIEVSLIFLRKLEGQNFILRILLRKTRRQYKQMVILMTINSVLN